MAAITHPNVPLLYAWDLAESGWKTGMDSNLAMLAALLHLSVKDRDLATPPGSPAAGDRYIVAASPTGAWVGHAGKVAVWIGSAWTIYAPKTGWRAYVEDEAKLSVYTGSAWSAGVSI